MIAERGVLAEADVFAFVYPLWFNAQPAILKGYVDRVFSLGFGFAPGAGGTEPLLAGLGMFFNQGQVCTSAARILIEKSIYDRTLSRLAEIADGMIMGAGRDVTFDGLNIGAGVAQGDLIFSGRTRRHVQARGLHLGDS